MSSSYKYSKYLTQVEAPFGDGAKITALRPFNAIITLLAGVAPGLVDGQIAPTTPTGLAISIKPFSSSTLITPTDLASGANKSRKVPNVFR